MSWDCHDLRSSNNTKRKFAVRLSSHMVIYSIIPAMLKRTGCAEIKKHFHLITIYRTEETRDYHYHATKRHTEFTKGRRREGHGECSAVLGNSEYLILGCFTARGVRYHIKIL